MSLNSFGSRAKLSVSGRTLYIHRLDALRCVYPNVARLPVTIKMLLENLLRAEDGRSVKIGDIQAVARWQAKACLLYTSRCV